MRHARHVTIVFTAVATENIDETAVTNTAATSVTFSSYRSNMSFSAGKTLGALATPNRRSVSGWRANRSLDIIVRA